MESSIGMMRLWVSYNLRPIREEYSNHGLKAFELDIQRPSGAHMHVIHSIYAAYMSSSTSEEVREQLTDS